MPAQKMVRKMGVGAETQMKNVHAHMTCIFTYYVFTDIYSLLWAALNPSSGCLDREKKYIFLTFGSNIVESKFLSVTNVQC